MGSIPGIFSSLTEGLTIKILQTQQCFVLTEVCPGSAFILLLQLQQEQCFACWWEPLELSQQFFVPKVVLFGVWNLRLKSALLAGERHWSRLSTALSCQFISEVLKLRTWQCSDRQGGALEPSQQSFVPTVQQFSVTQQCFVCRWDPLEQNFPRASGTTSRGTFCTDASFSSPSQSGP